MNSPYEQKLMQRIKLLEEQNESLKQQINEKKQKVKEYYERPEVKERTRQKAKEYYERNKEKILKKAKEKYIKKKAENVNLSFD